MKSRPLDILVEISPAETRVAMVDREGVLRGFHLERRGDESLLGGVWLARVTAIEADGQIAFLDIGGGRSVLVNRPPRGLTQGASAVVQVTREGRGEKGPAGILTPVLEGVSQAYLPGRMGIDWPRAFGKGKARSEMEAKLDRLYPDGAGLDGMRPLLAGLEISDKDFAREAEMLRASWAAMEADRTSATPPVCLLKPAGLIDRLLREAGPEDRLAVDDRVVFRALEERLLTDLKPWRGRIAFHPGPEPILSLSDVEDQLETALARVVPLTGGGRLVIDRTEALTAIDVDLGDGTADGEEAVLRLNLRAAREVARQILLRDLAGLIVIDFVRMKAKGRLGQILDILKSGLRTSRTPVDVLGMSSGGLVEITRQRAGAALDEVLLRPLGQRALAAETVAAILLRKVLRLTGAGVPVLVAPAPVLAVLRTAALAEALAETERRMAQSIALRQGDSPEALLERTR